MPGDSQALRTTCGPDSAGEPVFRVPLSQVEKHRAELAALHARVAELESWLAEMPELRAECESLGDQLFALRAVLGPPPLPEHVDHNPFAELTERARLLVEEVYGSDPRPRDVRRVAHDRARVEHIKLLERAVRSQVHENRSMRRTLQMAAETLDDVGVAASLGMMLPRATVDKAASAARTWLATGGPTRVHELALSERAQRRLVRWFGRTPGRAGHELAQRSGSRVVALVRAEMETAEAAKMSRTPTAASKKPKPSAPPAPPSPSTTAQVDIEEAIARATTAPPAKPKRTRAKKAKRDTTTPTTSVEGLSSAEGITITPDGSVWSAAEARRRDAEDPDWQPEPEWAPDGGRLRVLEAEEAVGRIGVTANCPSAKALAEIRSGKRCNLCGRRAWRSEHTRGCPNEAADRATADDRGACPHDPDGQHFIGCGCEA